MGDAVRDGSAAGFRCRVDRGALDADAMMLALDVEGFWIGFGTCDAGVAGWLWMGDAAFECRGRLGCGCAVVDNLCGGG